MDLSYIEIKEDMRDSYKSLCENANYLAKDSFYAALNDYQCQGNSSQIEECCIYVNFALVLIKHGENIDFMKKRMYELIDKKNYTLYELELKDEFAILENDINTLKSCL